MQELLRAAKEKGLTINWQNIILYIPPQKEADTVPSAMQPAKHASKTSMHTRSGIDVFRAFGMLIIWYYGVSF